MWDMSIQKTLEILAAHLLIILVWAVVWLIANWRIFTKAGEPGWKCIVPFYNEYTIYKFTWKAYMFWVTIGVSLLATIMNNLFQDSSMSVLVSAIGVIAVCVLNIKKTHRMAKVFGHGVGFTLGLLFFNPLFVLILAFGSSKYQGNEA